MDFPNRKETIKTAQKLLNIGVDGSAGYRTWAAIGNFVGVDIKDKPAFQIIPLVQKKLGLEADSIDGKLTWAAIIKVLEAEKPAQIVESNKKPVWPKENYSDLVKFYGEVGTNQVFLTLPYKMKLAWDLKTEVTRISCHAKVKDSLGRIFQKTLDHYGLEKIKELRLDIFGGCLNVRKMRGGSSWSMHSWGIAVDLDPDNNQLKWGKDKATFAKPEYDAFWAIVEGEGWSSLGRKRNRDYMHFSATRY